MLLAGAIAGGASFVGPRRALAASSLPVRGSGPEIYSRFGVKPFINCTSTYTINGGSAMLPEVIEAMNDASYYPVNFDELMEGVNVMKKHREGKLTLRSYKEEVTPLPAVDSKFIRETRKRMRCSRAVFARKLRINERTLEKWEQGRAKPNPQGAALVLLVRRYPDTLERLERVAAG